ncbi:MAG: hypothetical protein ACUVXI_02075 [bacterium]
MRGILCVPITSALLSISFPQGLLADPGWGRWGRRMMDWWDPLRGWGWHVIMWLLWLMPIAFLIVGILLLMDKHK